MQQSHLNPKSGSQVASFFSSVASVASAEVTDPATVTVKLKAPNVQFQCWAAQTAGFIFKKDQLTSQDIGTSDGLPFGTGPCNITKLAPAEKVMLEARADCWGGAPIIQKITIVAIPDEQTRILAMTNCDIDGTFAVSITNIDQWKKAGDGLVYPPSVATFLLTLDQTTAPFDDVHLRRTVPVRSTAPGWSKPFRRAMARF